MKRLFAVLGFVLGTATIPAQAEILDLNVGNNSFRGAFAGPLSRFLSGTNGQYDIGLLVRPRTSDDLLQVHTGVLVTGDVGAKDVDLAAGLGARLIYTGRDHDSGGALALGGQLEGRLPSANRFGLTGYGYYGPKVTSYGEVNGYQEYGIDLDYALIRGGSVYVGYRNIKEDVASASGKINVDQGGHIGFRLKF